MAVFVMFTPAYAQNTTNSTVGGKGFGMTRGGFRGSGVFGTVSAVNGSTLTVVSKMRQKGAPNNTTTTTPTTVTYTVLATNATITKNGASGNISSILVGDTVMVQGTVSGTSVTAKTIRDGMPQNSIGKGNQIGTLTEGNGQPVIGGNVTVISGNILTVVNKSNVTYTVDATSAKIEKDGATSAVGNIVVGDRVVVQGAVNGNSITATTIIDEPASAQAPTGTTTGTNPSNQGQHRGFFGAIGDFFGKIFGF